MGVPRKILALTLALILVGQTVLVDYHHHHLVTGIPDSCMGMTVGSCGGQPANLFASSDFAFHHDEGTCPFCLFLQNYHSTPTNAILWGAGAVYLAIAPLLHGDSAILPGHLDHAGPRAPPTSQV